MRGCLALLGDDWGPVIGLADTGIGRLLPGTVGTYTGAGGSIFAGFRATTTKDASTGTFTVLSTIFRADIAVVDALSLHVDSVSTDRAHLNCLSSSASRTEHAWRALVATFVDEINGVLLGSFSVTDESGFARHAPIDIKVGTRLTIFRGLASSGWTG